VQHHEKPAPRRSSPYRHQSRLPGALPQHRPYPFWLNLDSKPEVDKLFAEWKAARAKIVSAPEG